jgi:antitoxin (DNA-binding transcriptional repressor) of toxin-antitoxin stability system
MVMIKANILEIKTKLSEYVDLATRGEQVVICRHNKPVAELRAIENVRTVPRPIGPLPGRPTFEVPASFFEPMADEELGLWEGVQSSDPLSPEWARRPARRASRVAEATFATPSRRRPTRRRP